MTTTAVTSMNTPPAAPAPTGPERIPLRRLTGAEARKLADARSGLWLIGVIILSAVAVAACTAAFWGRLTHDTRTEWTFGDALVSFVPMMLLPVLAILLVTSEWSTRCAMTTFTLEPRRGRVVLAKAIVVVLATVVVWLLCKGLTAAAAVAGGHLHPGHPVSWHVDRAALAGDISLAVLLALMALSLALLLGNAPATIVIYMAQPLMTTSLGMIPGLGTVMGWASVNGLSLLSTGSLAGRDWVHVAVSATIWILIPAVVGTVLSLRREVK